VFVLIQESEQSCICVLGVSILLFLRLFYCIFEMFRQCDIVLFFISFSLNPDNKKVEENLSEKVFGISDRNIGNFE